MKWLCIISLLLFSLPGRSQTLNWVWLDFPPAYIGDGPQKGRGIVNRWLPELQRQVLPEFNHQYVEMIPARAWQTMKENELLCHAASLKTADRIRYAAFSIAWNLVPQKSVIIRALDRESQYGKQPVLSAKNLFQRQDIRLGMITDKNFYVHLKPWLAGSVAERQALVQGNQHSLLNLYKMLLNKRIDYLLEYPWVIGYADNLLVQQGRYLRHQTAALPIKELPQFAKAYISCTNNQQGRALIERMNRWIKAQQSQAKFRDHIGMWLDQATRQRFYSAYEQQISPVTD